jgi:hypothetical protein
LLAAGLSSNFRKKKGSILRTVPSSWTAQPPRAIQELENNGPVFHNNDSMEDSIRCLSSKNFNQKFVKSFAKWSGSTLIAASDENLHNVCKDRAEVARLITLLEVEIRKSEEVSQQSPSTVIDISGDEPAEKSTYSTKGGEYCFATLDDNLMSQPSKQEGRRKVVEAGVLIRICGLENFKKFTKIGEIGFTASAILDRIKLDHLKE